MDKLTEHAMRMLEIVDNERGFYKDMDGDVADIARAVYDIILRVQVLEHKADRKTENSSEKPNNYEPRICDTCRYYNSYIPCGSTPSACKKADKFAEEFVDGLKQLKPKDEPQTERIKTHDYCDICNHKGCKNCTANSLDDYCVPSGYEPTTQTETQNSNLTFEKADEPQTDCESRKHYNPNHEAIACERCLDGKYSRYEPQTDCPWK